ncbi:MAG: hypothetical protein KBS78_07435 [Bacteroidales bacterium]|nr:hypothetical protein [Candidatus Cryptobacteroides faecihippi]
MAEIIYKKGCDGHKPVTLSDIEGISLELLNGETIVVFPKYKDVKFLDREKISKYTRKNFSEFDALHVKSTDATILTDELLALESPAAKHVREQGAYDLPSLLAAGEIMKQRDEIDKLARTIEGADLFDNCGSSICTCCRDSAGFAWYAHGGSGFFNGGMYSSFLAVPVALLKY